MELYLRISIFSFDSTVFTSPEKETASHPQISDLHPCNLQFSKFELFETDEVLSWLEEKYCSWLRNNIEKCRFLTLDGICTESALGTYTFRKHPVMCGLM